MHLLAMGLLYVGTFNFLKILFVYADKLFPDALDPYYNPASAIRWPVAILVVVFPVFLWVSRFLTRDITANPAKADLKVRKWLVYLTLFLSAVLIIGDLVTLIYNFLEGDLTARFLMKIGAVLVVAATIFRYYLHDLRRAAGPLSSKARMWVWVIVVVVGVATIGGFFVAGSPFRQRLVKFDERRVGDLQMIQGQIVNFWQNKSRLPNSLDELRDPISGFVSPVDPDTGVAYSYNKSGPLSFSLCANFSLESQLSAASRRLEPAAPEIINGKYLPETWDHPAGEYCFERSIDPELYRLKY